MSHRTSPSDIHIVTHHLSQMIDTPIEESLERLIRLSKRMFDIPFVTINLFDEKRHRYDSLNKDLAGLSQSIPVFENDEVLVVEDAAEDERFAAQPLMIDDISLRFYVSCPIFERRGRKVGAITLLDTKPRTFCLTDLSILNDIIKLAEAEINNCRLSKAQKLMLDEINYDQRSEFIDQKTRAWNYAGFKKILAYQINDSVKFNQCFGLASIDIDHLKGINDTYGIETGDEILKMVSKTLLRICRAEDTIGRGKNSDFLALIHTHNLANIASVVQRFHTNLSELTLNTSRGDIDFTVTIGYSCFEPQLTQEDSLLNNTELALLRGKREGRNCISYFDEQLN